MNSANMDAKMPELFRTYSSQDEEPIVEDCTIWQAARATTAAPTFFKPITIGNQSFIDGVMAHNNPTSLALREVARVFPNGRLACVLSLGTGKSETISIPKKRHVIQRMLPLDVIMAIQKIATECESVHQTVEHRFSNTPGVYFRFNVEQGLQAVSLSDWERLADVEAHTRQYLKLGEVESKLKKVVGVLLQCVGVVPTQQISMYDNDTHQYKLFTIFALQLGSFL